MGTTIGQAYIDIMPSTQNFSGDLKNSLSGLSGVVGTAGAAIGAAVTAGIGATIGLTTAVSGLAETGDAIDKSSQKLGVSSKFYQEWDAVLQHSGTSMESVGTSFKTLAKASQDASKSQVAAFDALGMSLEDVANMSQEDLFSAVITGLQGMEEGTERTYIAQQLLGRGAMEMGALLNTSAEDTQKMISTVNELGGVLSDTAISDSAKFEDNLQDLKTAMSGLVNGMLTEFLPGFNTVMEGFTAFISGDENGLAQITEGIQGILGKVTEMLPQFLELGMSILEGLASAIITNLPSIAQTGVEIISSLASFIIQNLPMLIEAGLNIIIQLANDLSANLPTLIPAIVEVMLTIVDTLINNIDQLVEASIQIIMALTEGIINALPILVAKAPDILIKLINALVENFPLLIDCALKMIKSLAEGLIAALPELASRVPEIIKTIISGLMSMISDIAEVGKNIVEGLWNGIGSKVDWLKEKIKSFASSALGAIKDFFGIHSPSTVFRDEVGKWIPEGMAIGIEANASAVTDAMDDLSEQTIGTVSDIDSRITANGNIGSLNTEDNNLYNLLAQYLPYLADRNNVNVSLEGDAAGMFKMMQRQNKQYIKSNGVSAFA